jgi:hypothetical protein
MLAFARTCFGVRARIADSMHLIPKDHGLASTTAPSSLAQGPEA